jgi:hypothetical protein
MIIILRYIVVRAMYNLDISRFHDIYDHWVDYYKHEMVFWAYLTVSFTPEGLRKWIHSHEQDPRSLNLLPHSRFQIYLENLRKALEYQSTGEDINEIVEAFNSVDLFD